MTLLRMRGVPAALLASIVVLDSTIELTSPPYGILGVLDEPAHIATAAIALGVAAHLRRLPLAFLFAALACSVLLDVDHVPQVLGWQGLTAGTPRPYSHSILTVAVLAMGSALTPKRRTTHRAVLGGACAGVALHLWRDLGTGQVSLLWPISLHAVDLPYAIYICSLGVLAGLALLPTRWWSAR